MRAGAPRPAAMRAAMARAGGSSARPGCSARTAAIVRPLGPSSRTPRVAARAARESAGNGTSTTAPGAQPDGPLASKNDPTVPTDESVYVCDDICSTATYGEAEMTEEAAEAQAKSDLFKAIAVGTGLGVTAGILDQPWVVSHEALTMSIVFAIGYVGIILEEEVSFNKSGVALVMAVALWTIAALGLPDGEVHAALSEKLSEVGEIVFFLIGAMTIVETVDAHQGFKVVTDAIKTRDRRALLWSIGTITFFMSAILDNLTSTIVMISLLRKLVPDADVRKVYGAAVVLAANAGGAWTPIGDVTTTMLWINGQITTGPTMRDLVLPSLASAALPLALMSFFTKEVQGTLPEDAAAASPQLAPRGKLVLASGIGALLFVPVFKSLTGLPPYLGMLAGLGALWLLTDAIHFGEEDRESLRVSNALSRIDSQGALFFLGILMSIGALDSMGILKDLARFMDAHIPSQEIIAAAIGLASAVIDNVPLVAATMGMYDISQHPVDSDLWQLIAYCAGTGGSILVIGSAAGVAFMGLEKVDFMWYVRKVSPWALAGYVGGMGVYLAQSGLHIPITSAFQQMLPHLS